MLSCRLTFEAPSAARFKGSTGLPRDVPMTCEVGMRNGAGEVYRRASVKGVAQMLYPEERMVHMGFVAGLEDSEHNGSGFDVIYRLTAGT